MKLSVIITTYNSEEWLEKVLTGYSVQDESDFEVVIADDGSTEKTKNVIFTTIPVPVTLTLHVEVMVGKHRDEVGI